SCARPQAENTRYPNANPANANATLGNIGKSQGCGAPRLCTPLMYDSRYHGSQRGRCVVQSGGVASAISAAAPIAAVTHRNRGTAPEAGWSDACTSAMRGAASQHTTPIKIIAKPVT